MTLVEFIATLRKRWLYVVLTFLAFSSLAYGVSKATTPVYTAEASVYFSLPVGQSGSDLNQGASYTQQQIGSFAELARSPIVLNPVSAKLGLGVSAKELARSVTATANAETVIIEIAATDPDPVRAAAIANAVTEQFGNVVRELSPVLPNGDPSVKAVTIANATVPLDQSAPNTRRNVAAGGLLGLFLGLLAALAREKLDTRARSEEDLPYGVSVLTAIEFDKNFRLVPLSSTRPSSRREIVREESYRKLRTGLRFLDIENPAKAIVITSSVAGEGKTSTSIGLASVLGGDGKRVLIVDADLRRPKVAEYTGLEGAIGLVDVLAGTVDIEVAAQPWLPDSVDVLPSGTIPPNPSELLGSGAMSDLIADLRIRYDYIVIDAPPLLPVTDASIAATQADGVVLVVRHGKTTRHQIAMALESVRAVNARVLGVILNRTPSPKPWKSRSAYHYYYQPDSTRSSRRRKVDTDVSGVADSDIADSRQPNSWS